MLRLADPQTVHGNFTTSIGSVGFILKAFIPFPLFPEHDLWGGDCKIMLDRGSMVKFLWA
jgi:hypothetical protein